MPRARKNLNKEPSVKGESHGNQTSLSKYFFASNTKPQNLGKRATTAASDGACSSAKSPKLTYSPKKNNIVTEVISPPEKVLQKDLESASVNLCEESQISEKTKSKLLSFTFSKHVKSKEETDSMGIENSVYRNVIYEEMSGYASDASDMNSDNVNGKELSTPKVIKYTPLEKQYLEFQSKYSDAILLIECGYKYRFFGKDAEIAHKDLNIGCYQYHNFLSASIPVHRLNFHVRRLILKGHKVGVIKQTESAALKAVGETRNELFSRELHAMYTKSTFIDGEISAHVDENSVEAEGTDEYEEGTGYLMCVNECQVTKNQSDSVSISFVAVQVSSGDIFYSSFQDSCIQNELEQYLMCINPSEVVLPSCELSKNTEHLIKSFCHERSRIERLDKKVFEPSFAVNNLTNFISSERNIADSTYDVQENLQTLLSMPSLVISCLSALQTYLSDFKLENILRNVKIMRPFSASDNMVLNAAAIRGLEILRSNSSPPNYGTLFWCMNRTLTKFGERLLKSWIVKPLKDIMKIEERLNIVTEIIHSESLIFKKISSILYKLPDLEKLLCCAFYHRCSCYEFLKLVKAVSSIRNELVGLTDKITAEIEVLKLKDILLSILKGFEGIEKFSSSIDPDAAKAGNKVDLFFDTTKYTSLKMCKSRIAAIEMKLNDLRPAICKTLRLPAFKYATVNGQKFLIEVPNGHLSLVPDEWLKINVTKQVSRFRSPEVIILCKELEQEQERLLECANEAWTEYLNEFGQEFYKYKRAVSYLAELDCYLSFAQVSKDEKYCRPLLVSSSPRNFVVEQGRHPVVVQLMGEEKQFVANDIELNETERCLIVTGPNMGGKSTYIRQVALLAIMAHMGCYIPAESAVIPLFDGIYVRMGADDDIVNNKSTFMCEMSEASNILSCATSQSLVILDELGRGTSTNDGAAIAYATLKYLIEEVKCFTLFVTHYPPLVELKTLYPENILTVHMAYILREDDDDNIPMVTFLYNVVPGVSEKSYGINVAALAGISKEILIEAQKKSREMELKMTVQRQLQKCLDYLKSKRTEESCQNS